LREFESLQLQPVWRKSPRSFAGPGVHTYTFGPFAVLQIGWLRLTGARLAARKSFCPIEVLAQSLAKLQPSSPGSRLDRGQTQVQRFRRLL